MRALLERLLLAFWTNEAQYLAERELELRTERYRLDKDLAECIARKRRAEMRQIQYARLT